MLEASGDSLWHKHGCFLSFLLPIIFEYGLIICNSGNSLTTKSQKAQGWKSKSDYSNVEGWNNLAPADIAEQLH